MSEVRFATWLDSLRGAPLQWPENRIARRSVDSTNRLGRSIVDALGADDEVPQPTMLVAWEQSAGRGRGGRTWESAGGLGLYATLVWPLPEGHSVATLPLVVAVVLCEGLSALLPEPCRLDWPNDLVVRKRKLGGILIESVTRQERSVVLIGFGVNLSHRGVELPPGATSLAAAGAVDYGSGAVLRALAAGLAEGLTTPPDERGLLERYRAASVHREGERISCRVGAETVAGTFAGFDPSGFLRLATPNGLRTFSSGDIVE